MGITYGNELQFVEYLENSFKCEWCNNILRVNTEIVNREYLEKQNEVEILDKEEICKCEKCGNKTRVFYCPWYQVKPPYLTTERVYKAGRKKKVEYNKIEEFISTNSLYQTYQLLHPNHIENFIDEQHYDFEEVVSYLEQKGFEIFIPMSRDEISAINISEYEEDFTKLILKESAMEEAGGASLSRLLGKTKVWENIRQQMLQKNKNTCQICGFRTNDTKLLHVHENWEVSEATLVLKSVQLICSRCHACKHRNQYMAYRVLDGQSELDDGIPRGDMLAIHLMKVNHTSKEVIYAYRKQLLDRLEKIELKKIEAILNGYKVEDIIYKYAISEGIPCREELEKILQNKNLLI